MTSKNSRRPLIRSGHPGRATIRIDGKIYTLQEAGHSKARAWEIAKDLRASGKLVRVIRIPGDYPPSYGIWVRAKR